MILAESVEYLENPNLKAHSKITLTYSREIQEECTYLKKLLLILRDNTERLIIVQKGTNAIIRKDFNKLKRCIEVIMKSKYVKRERILTSGREKHLKE